MVVLSDGFRVFHIAGISGILTESDQVVMMSQSILPEDNYPVINNHEHWLVMIQLQLTSNNNQHGINRAITIHIRWKGIWQWS